ncbi:hypothetical protein A2841_01070 [Candidatus Kaiserbacteria bacterium RIFCSPHIGHO2_01_FULL_48_10]|uniref:HTH deoR-type domain-containing protein n=1 Tax=Candidatus Kaiserbacteria bacterium RIFCSPHIGHO2_01_FULL_48_10 TaxID=1798476 RepID=A0A1F6C3X4_9BACT|nr:MAG: hypothetical protein A2841_01070 [Candidatus Kaiserbacteria bacterium RIFCSPHIGHO2_01_FULL_48_10]
MNYVILIIVALGGIALGMYIAGRNKGESGLIEKQMEKKTESKQKILNFLQQHPKIQNNDVEKLASVSNATAERYLNELEKEGKLTQHGTIGQDVFYTLK